MHYDVFISYRRDGGYQTAKHLYDLLRLEGYDVSFDLDTLRNGDFDSQLLSRIDECTDFILILSPGAFDRSIQPDFDRNKDWMRIELARALEKNLNVIPIMLPGFDEFPDNLPDDIKDVTRKNGPKHSMEYFDEFYNRLKTRFMLSRPISEERKVLKQQSTTDSSKPAPVKPTDDKKTQAWKERTDKIGEVSFQIEDNDTNLQFQFDCHTAASRVQYQVKIYYKLQGEKHFCEFEPIDFNGKKEGVTIEASIDTADLNLKNNDITVLQFKIRLQRNIDGRFSTVDESNLSVKLFHQHNLFSKNHTKIAE